jgi:hypothetical protein
MMRSGKGLDRAECCSKENIFDLYRVYLTSSRGVFPRDVHLSPMPLCRHCGRDDPREEPSCEDALALSPQID